jgi:hypothetical protein
MINMTLKWHHKNISNQITIFIKFWQSPNVVFGSFDYDSIPMVLQGKWGSLMVCGGDVLMDHIFHLCGCPIVWNLRNIR